MHLPLSLRLLLVAVQFFVFTMALPNAERVRKNMKPLMVSGFDSLGASTWAMPAVCFLRAPKYFVFGFGATAVCLHFIHTLAQIHAFVFLDA